MRNRQNTTTCQVNVGFSHHEVNLAAGTIESEKRLCFCIDAPKNEDEPPKKKRKKEKKDAKQKKEKKAGTYLKLETSLFHCSLIEEFLFECFHLVHELSETLDDLEISKTH